jgi:hypothetical protein
MDSALARRRVAGDGGAAGGEESDRQVLPWRQPNHRRYLPGDASDAGAAVHANVEPYKRVMRIYDACMAIPAFAEAHPHKQPDFEGH